VKAKATRVLSECLPLFIVIHVVSLFRGHESDNDSSINIIECVVIDIGGVSNDSETLNAISR